MLSTNSTIPEKVYFKNLNSLRFIAAFLVIVQHTELTKVIFHYPYPDNKLTQIIQISGPLGVILFFVLSGFLISYLLFKEKDTSDTIHIGNFYMRRILRIWPLYFLIILLSLFILPFINFFTLEGFSDKLIWGHFFLNLSLYTLFLPNLARVIIGSLPYAYQTWTIGVEEQFYLAWPFLNKYCKNKWVMIFGAISMYYVIKLIFHFLPKTNVLNIISNIWAMTPINCMAIGGLFAAIIYETNRPAKFLKTLLFTKSVQLITLVTILLSVYEGFNFPYFNYEYYSVLFGIVISNLAVNEHRLFSIENKYTNYLGKISYGLYLLHPLAIVTAIKCLLLFGPLHNYLLYPLIFSITIAIAALSYEFFEKQFIRKKVKYSSVISGENAVTPSLVA
jgi:peptidoglycan/LPS O-acetylase OafA/YrhL